MKREIPDILVEQLLLDELDPAMKESIQESPEVPQRLELLRASNTEILERYPPGEMVRRIEGRLRAVQEAEAVASEGTTAKAGRGRRHGLPALLHRRGFIPAMAAVAVVALVVGLLPLLLRGGMGPQEGTGVRIKGAGPVLHVYRETPQGVELVKNGASASAHDLLQLSYIAAGARYGMIFSVDGSGTVTLHYPESSPLAERLSGGGEVALPHSYELDNAPKFERFYLVTSASEFPVNEILGRARREVAAGRFSLSFPRGFRVAVVTVRKEPRQ